MDILSSCPIPCIRADQVCTPPNLVLRQRCQIDIIRTWDVREHKFSEISVNTLDVEQSIQSKWLQILLLFGTELNPHVDME